MVIKLLIIFTLGYSCSFFSVRESRKIAGGPRSIFQYNCGSMLLYGSEDKLTKSCWMISKDIEKEQSKFRLSPLKTPFYKSRSYFIQLSSPDELVCSKEDVLKKISKYFYKVTLEEEVNCEFKLKENRSLTFILPYFEPFPVSEAEWMKGFYPNIVNQSELKLSQILDKWKRAKDIKKDMFVFDDGITYRARELLMKYLVSTSLFSIIPNRFEYTFRKILKAGDLLRISAPTGIITHPKYGETNYLGYETEDFLQNQTAGKKYLVKSDIRPFEFFCKFKEEYFHFRNSSFLVFKDAGTVKCGINVKRKSILQLRYPKGYIDFGVNYMDLEQSIARIPSYISNARVRIENRVIQMNEENKIMFQNLFTNP